MSHPTIKHYMAWATDSHSYINHNYIQIHLSPQIHIIPRKFKHNKMLIESKDKCHICLLHSFMTSIITKYIPYSVLGLQVILGIGLLARRPSNSGYMCMEHTNWSLRHTILSLHRRLQTGPAFQSTFFSKNSGRSCFAGKAISVWSCPYSYLYSQN